MAYNQKLNIFMNEGKRHPKAFNNSKSIHAHKPNYNIYMQKIAKALLYTGYAHNKPRELWFPPVRCVVFRNGGGEAVFKAIGSTPLWFPRCAPV